MDQIPDVSNRRALPAQGIEQAPWGDGLELRRRRYGPLRASMGRAMGVPAFRTVRLDALAADAWSLMDGSRTVGAVRVQLEQRHAGVDDVGSRLGRLVGLLVSQGFLQLE